MKIMFITDIHNNYRNIYKLPFNKVDLLIIGGDFTIRGGRKDARIIIEEILKNFGNKIFAIPGNMDKPEVLDLLIEYDMDLECRGRIINEFGFFGCGGSEKTPFDTPNEKNSDSIFNCLLNGYNSITDARIKIMVSHNPPFGVECDKTLIEQHVGSKSIRNFIENYAVDYCFTGHIHEGIGKDFIGKTLIINPGPFQNGYYAILDLNNNYVSFNNI